MRFSVLLLVMLLTACHPSQKDESKNTQSAQKLPSLTLKNEQAKYALPFCEKKECIDIDIQTINTQDAWLNSWIEKQQSKVIQAQIELKQNLTLQQAVDAYIKKSDAWQQEFSQNHAYQLRLNTRIASQRHQYVLLQLTTNTKQAEVDIQDRQYFAVADRLTQKNLTILDVILPQKQQVLDAMIQAHYQDWIKQQTALVQEKAPKKLYWGQADWFFDSEGIGVHYRTNEIVDGGQQLDIYLNHEQTKQVLQPDVLHEII
ncbi:hypothetical protein [Acinetobacter sp. HY1485]|uniref:hypothetical protein n=1 Tax=Acinetobacter sp. HY1485 TaxID=2970918 RepID=UPI0022B9A21B|nr:hypothetical protein [Acinetobacter sp. HY1485]